VHIIHAILTATHVPNNQPLNSSPEYGVKSYGPCFSLLNRQNFKLHCTSLCRRQTDCPDPRMCKKKIFVRSGIRTHALRRGLRPERSALDHSAIRTLLLKSAELLLQIRRAIVSQLREKERRR
jgi:hypothetical protein